MQELNYIPNLVILLKNGLPCWIGFLRFGDGVPPLEIAANSKNRSEVVSEKIQIKC